MRVIRRISNAGQFWHLIHQGFFNAMLERDVYRRTTLTTAAKLQHRDFVGGDFDQGNLTTMSGQTRVHFVVQDVIDAVFQRRICTNLGYSGIGRLDRQLSPIRSSA